MADKTMYCNKPIKDTINAIKHATEITVSSYVDELEEKNSRLEREIKVLWECFRRLKSEKEH